MKSILRSGMALVAAAVLGAGLFAATDTLAPAKPGNGAGGKPTTAEAVYLDDIKDSLYAFTRQTPQDTLRTILRDPVA